MIVGAAAVTIVPEPKKSDKGLIFVKDTDILLSGDKWTIVVNIALDDYDTLVFVMREILEQIRSKIQVYKNKKFFSLDLHWEEIGRLDKMVDGINSDLESFQKLLFDKTLVRTSSASSARSKRGLIDILGYGMKYLFGTADAKDVKRLANVCDELHAFETRVMHAADHQLTYIRTLDEMVRRTIKDTTELAGTLRDSIRNLSLSLNRVEADLLDTQVAMENQARYSAAIREIETAILETKLSITQLQESLEVTSIGKLSSVLIKPHNLSSILQQVSLQLPAGLSMLTGLTVEEMYVYYTVATVHAVATPTSIRLLIDIPLKAADRYFELYQVHSLPFLHKGIGKFVMVDEAFTYLAVAENRQFFAIMTPYMLARCTQDLYTVCPSDLVLKTAGEQNCLIALFLGKVDTVFTRCKRLVLNESFEPVWIRSPDSSYWIYSLSTPQQVTVQCQEVGSSQTTKSSYQIMLKGTGVLPNSSSCYIHAENFKLLVLPHSLGGTTVNLFKTHIALPNVENIVKFSEEGLLQTNDTYPVDMGPLEDIVERVTSRGIDVSKAITALRGREVYHRDSSKTLIISCIVVFVGLGLLWFIWFKVTGQCCPFNWRCVSPRPMHMVDDGQELKVDDARLQMQQREKEKPESEVAEGEVPESQTTPTLFVLRGHLGVDHS
jgi:hypothetical protein